MTKAEKQLARLLARPSDFTWSELETLLGNFGYEILNAGKTSGSRVRFIRPETKHKILLHKPHPGEILRKYQIDYVLESLREQGLIGEESDGR